MANIAGQLKRGISRQLSSVSLRRTFSRQFTRQASHDPRRINMRFSFGRQSSLDPIRRSPEGSGHPQLAVPDNLDATMQLLFVACRGDVEGVQDLLDERIDVNSIDLDGRTALHIAACEGHVDVVKLLLTRKANIDARDRWGSTAAADAKYYGNMDVYNILKARGAKVPKTKKTPMVVANPRHVPDYELNPQELQGIYQVAKWNGTKVSVKILDKDLYKDRDTINAFKHELTLFEKVRHPNVVQFVGAVTQNVPMMIVSEVTLGAIFKRKGAFLHPKGMNYLHECKPEPVIHCDLKPKNIMLDNGGLLKVAGFGLISFEKLSSDKSKVLNHGAHIDLSNYCVAPEVYRDEIFDRSADSYSFGVVLYEMIEGVQPFHPKPPEEAVKLMCLEGRRPSFKAKTKSCPEEMRELIEECWDVKAVVRPTFSEIIVRLDRIFVQCSKQGWWKDTFKFPW
ncbi:hypothetical protein F2Q69_00001470 [Brassica cretica]|uniref:Protein kinase domain-containing protein n=1 Tax=Brassica cretica TaxID=69181 RepID=A0A8S9NT26_BRACR|nr:hypothetical protein F2Q69_00001470 [Brassica cretica]